MISIGKENGKCVDCSNTDGCKLLMGDDTHLVLGDFITTYLYLSLDKLNDTTYDKHNNRNTACLDDIIAIALIVEIVDSW